MSLSSPRLNAIDALRGLAVVWMAAFHLGFDLNHHGWIRQDFLQDPFWTWQRTCIVSLFLFCAGLGQAAAHVNGQGLPRFWRRWCQIAGCAALVSLGSWWMFPQSYIYFGVLHGIAVMLLLVRFTANWGPCLWWMGAMALAAPFVAEWAIQHNPALAILNAKPLNWLGLISAKPRTEDYVPVLPWLGVMWWGMATGTKLLKQSPAWLERVPAPKMLALLGRWSLSFYMLHQPLFLGLLAALALLTRHA